MQINPEIFKAYDIRGIYGKDFGEEFAYKLGLAYGRMRLDEMNGRSSAGEDKIPKIVAAEDMRLSSSALKKNLIKGLAASGVDVVDIGLSSTPTFYFAVAYFNYDGGIIVSASHNPAAYNGFKLTRAKAAVISKDTGMFDLRDRILNSGGSLTTDGAVKGKIIKKENVLAKQVEHDLKYADISKIKPFKIAIDAANGMGAQYFDELLKYLPGAAVKMNWKLDGRFPAHEADPLKPENMEDLKNKVKKEGADLGIATDGDGDRIFFTDETGETVEPGILRAVLSKIFLRDYPGAKIVYDIRPGKITPDTIIQNGGVPIVARVGHSLIKDLVVSEGAVFAGESSGHFFLNMDEGCYEVPMIVALKILQELSESGQKFSSYIKPYKKYFHSGEINSRVKDVRAKIAEIKERYKDGQQNELDGIMVEYPDFWFNVRLSNTEPLLRLNLEAKTKELMEEKRDEVLKLINSNS